MNAREWQKYAREYLLPYFPGYAMSGRWIFAAPIGWQVRGFCVEPSGYDKQSFTVEVGVLPLYVPQSPGGTFTARLGWLQRRRADVWWNLGTASPEQIFTGIRQRLLHEGRAYLKARSTLEAMTKIRRHQIIHLSSDCYVFQAMLCAGILLNDPSVVERERKHLRLFAQQCPKDEMQEWEITFNAATEDIYQRYSQNPTAASEEIAHWRQQRAAELKLGEFLAEEPDDLRGGAPTRFRWWKRS